MRTTLLLTAVVALGLAACGDDDTAEPAEPAEPAPTITDETTPTDEPADEVTDPVDEPADESDEAIEATVRVATHPELGEHLVDTEGITLYLFALDEGTTTACIGACADLWPPLVANGPPVAGDGIDQEALSSAEGIEPDQVVYHGHLLYYYVDDQEPGDIVGTAIPEWYAVHPDGSAIGQATTSTGPGGY